MTATQPLTTSARVHMDAKGLMLEPLLTPKTVAVIGASRTPGKVGHDIVANLVRGGFAGEILPVNPSTDEILGLGCYPDLKSCGHSIDLSVIAVPTAAVRQAVESSIQAGTRAIVVITAGFKEVGAAGATTGRTAASGRFWCAI